MKDDEKRRLDQIKSLEVEIKKLKDDIARPPPEGLASEEQLQDEAVSDFSKKIAYPTLINMFSETNYSGASGCCSSTRRLRFSVESHHRQDRNG